MGAELVWAKAKQMYRKKLHAMVAREEEIDHPELVRDVMQSLDDDFCMRCADHGIRSVLQAKPIAMKM